MGQRPVLHGPTTLGFGPKDRIGIPSGSGFDSHVDLRANMRFEIQMLVEGYTN